MPYIVLDLEWNQAMSANAPIFNRLPIKLRGEIIQIGAVKITDDMQVGEEFQIDIKPIYFRRIHYKVKKLTGFDKDRLSKGESFSNAIDKFLEWCGPDCTFLTWGCDDKSIMEQNLIIHDLDIDWMGNWVNLQVIFNMQVEGNKNQKSLSTAMEHFGIEQTRIAHDALGDAYNTALVCTKLNLKDGLNGYDQNHKFLPCEPAGKLSVAGVLLTEPLEHKILDNHASRDEVWLDSEIVRFHCPECGGTTTQQKWVNQGDRRYMTLAKCRDHGCFLVRIRLRQAEDNSWFANKLVYRADDKMIDFYKSKSNQNRRFRKRRRKAPSNKIDN